MLIIEFKNTNFPRDRNDLSFVILPVRNFPLKTHHPVYLYNVDQTTAGWHISDSDTLLSCAPSTRASSIHLWFFPGDEIRKNNIVFPPPHRKSVLSYPAPLSQQHRSIRDSSLSTPPPRIGRWTQAISYLLNCSSM